MVVFLDFFCSFWTFCSRVNFKKIFLTSRCQMLGFLSTNIFLCAIKICALIVLRSYFVKV